MMRLYYTWKSAAMAPHIALEEIGAAYELVYIDFSKPWPRDYLKLNPHRKVPTLVDDDGEVFYQAAAILLHLADRFPDAGLAPPPGSRERGHLYKVLFFMAEMLQPAYHMHFYPERHVAAAACEPSVDAKASEWLTDLWGRIDVMIGAGPYLLGERFSLADIYLTMLATWNQPRHTPLRSYAAVWRDLELAAARPSTKTVFAHNGIAGLADIR
jgi:glutathione S-transferase